MSTTVYVPCDAAAIALGADATAEALNAEAIRRGEDVRVVRNGSRGLVWLEPMVEVQTPEGRVAYGPVTPNDVSTLFEGGFLHGGNHTLGLGLTEEIPWLKRQERLTFARVGITDPLSLDDYTAHAGYRGLQHALDLSPAEIVREVTESGLRGRGGAAFPTGIKWDTVLRAEAPQKYIACNADEGDSGTFSDRMIMEGDPFALIEGMTIAGHAVGATIGYIYVRSEYPHAVQTLHKAIQVARDAGWLGNDICGSGTAFDIEVRVGAGAYICGEETSMLESLEGKRGMIRPKPPLPAIKGLFGMPTAVNNVVSLASLPIILDRGAKYYADFGVGRSRGTLPIQLAGNLRTPGLVEKAFGVTLRELIEDFGGGTASGRPARAVQIGGPLGAYFGEKDFDLPLDYEQLAENFGIVGHGGIVVFDDTVDMAEQARFAMEFCGIESCGKCTPCRVGSTRGTELIERIILDQDKAANHNQLLGLLDVMENTSLCALGGMAHLPVTSAMRIFPEDFGLDTAAETSHVE
ncbi:MULTISPECIES: NADH-quinone oxidoreductase subunit NuoF [unclassified Thioalkalivibrio]|uniref:formate dehydrogenase beta subunit n=1 Tax=unclassified Thioalkalivibrio TaxID=2621013 RepID=UPI00037D3D8B|nr:MULTISPECIES: formate dehydrogenase beta subunit [unclassified Thioalkalivibrio]